MYNIFVFVSSFLVASSALALSHVFVSSPLSRSFVLKTKLHSTESSFPPPPPPRHPHVTALTTSVVLTSLSNAWQCYYILVKRDKEQQRRASPSSPSQRCALLHNTVFSPPTFVIFLHLPFNFVSISLARFLPLARTSNTTLVIILKYCVGGLK